VFGSAMVWELLPDLHEKLLVGLDGQSLCSSVAVSTAWCKPAKAIPAWRCALLQPQVPPDPPGTYASVFTETGLDAYCHAISDASGNKRIGANELSNESLFMGQSPALRRLICAPPISALCALAHYVRRAHSGVEAEVVKIRDHCGGLALAVHVAIEIFNFFPFPIWVFLSVGQDAPQQLGQQNVFLHARGFSHGTSCATLPDRPSSGSIVICTAETKSGSMDFMQCPSYQCVEIGEHVLYTGADFPSTSGGTLKLFFTFATQVAVGKTAEPLEKILDMTTVCAGERVLIPTTRRGNRYELSDTQWAERGVQLDAVVQNHVSFKESLTAGQARVEACVVDMNSMASVLPLTVGSVAYRGEQILSTPSIA